MKIKTQNENFKYQENLGQAVTFLNHDEDFIIVEGQGTDYKKREQQEILIVIEGKTIFKGTKWELQEKLIK